MNAVIMWTGWDGNDGVTFSAVDGRAWRPGESVHASSRSPLPLAVVLGAHHPAPGRLAREWGRAW